VCVVNNTVFQRRRAERFAQLLAEPGRRPPGDSPRDGELGEYVALGLRLRQTAHPPEAIPDDAFRTSLRAMLVATATREGIGRTAVGAAPALGRVGVTRPEPDTVPIQVGLRSRRTRGAIVVGLAASTLALSGISAASGDATPVNALSGPQRAAENAQLAQTTSDILRGQLYLRFAASRADEAKASRDNAADLTARLGLMDSQTQQGVRLLATWAANRRDPRALDDIDAWLPVQRERLAALDTGAPARRVERSLTLLSRVSDRSTALRAALACGAITKRSDDLGSIPGTCPTLNGTGGNGTRGGHTASTGPSSGTGNSSGLHPSIPAQAPSPTPEQTAATGPSAQPTAGPPLAPPSKRSPH
jgi:hypothetical protein